MKTHSMLLTVAIAMSACQSRRQHPRHRSSTTPTPRRPRRSTTSSARRSPTRTAGSRTPTRPTRAPGSTPRTRSRSTTFEIPERARIKARLTTLWNYERYGTPSREGGWYIFARNTGLQNQAVIYKAKALDAEPEVLIDPNTLSTDGTVALGGTSFTDDGRYMAYSLAGQRVGLDRVARARRRHGPGPAGRRQVVEVQRGGVDEGRLGLLLQPLRRAEGRRRSRR